MTTQRIVIVGGVAGGASAATRARRMNERAEIVLIERGEHVSFANCGLPYHIGGEIAQREALLVATPESLARRFGLDVRTRHEVTRIDRAAKQVEVERLASGERYLLAYDKLILAPGARALVPPAPGADAAGCFALRDMSDMDRIIARLEGGEVRRVVVVGAGYVGLEVAEQLRHRGVEVAVVELQDQVLPLLDPEIAAPVEAALRAAGVEVRTGDAVQEVVTSGGQARGVRLKSGAQLDAELILWGIGVRANKELAERAGLELFEGRAIAVDRHMRTSDPDIYAVGDAAVYPCALTDASRWVPLAGPANRAGRIAGEHAATGASAPMGGVLATSIVRVFSRAAGITGLTERAARRAGLDARSVTIIAASHASYFPGAHPLALKLVYEASTGRVLGLQAEGEDGVDKRLDVVACAIRGGLSVEQLAELDLAYAPPFGAAKDPLHQAAFAASNARAGLARFEPSDSALEAVQVVDVRSAEEVASRPLGRGQVRNIPLDVLRIRASELDRAAPIVTVCAVGKRGYYAARILSELGFKDVRILSGGVEMAQRAWARRP